MAKKEEPKTTKLTYGDGDNAVTVSVADDRVEALVAGGQFKKASTRRSSSSD